jgi:hypothetical protein
MMAFSMHFDEAGHKPHAKNVYFLFCKARERSRRLNRDDMIIFDKNAGAGDWFIIEWHTPLFFQSPPCTLTQVAGFGIKG